MPRYGSQGTFFDGLVDHANGLCCHDLSSSSEWVKWPTSTSCEPGGRQMRTELLGAGPEIGEIAPGLLQRKPGRGGRHRQSSHRSPADILDGDSQTAHALEELLVVLGVTAPPDLEQLPPQRGGFGQRVLGLSLELDRAQEPLPQPARGEGEEEFPVGGAVNRDPAPGLEVQEERPGALHPVEVDDLQARKHPQVDRLPELLGEALEEDFPVPVGRGVTDRVKAEVVKSMAHAVAARERVLLEEPLLFQDVPGGRRGDAQSVWGASPPRFSRAPANLSGRRGRLTGSTRP